MRRDRRPCPWWILFNYDLALSNINSNYSSVISIPPSLINTHLFAHVICRALWACAATGKTLMPRGLSWVNNFWVGGFLGGWLSGWTLVNLMMHSFTWNSARASPLNVLIVVSLMHAITAKSWCSFIHSPILPSVIWPDNSKFPPYLFPMH